MGAKLKGRSIRLSHTFEIDGPSLARVIAFSATRDADGSYVPPPWARSRNYIERQSARLLAEHGEEFFEEAGGWSAEINAHEIEMARHAGQAIVSRFYPELA